MDNNNPEARKLTGRQKIATLLFGLACIVFLIFYIISLSRDSGSNNSRLIKDAASGVEYSDYSGQPSTKNSLSSIGFEKLLESGINSNVYDYLMSNITTFISSTNDRIKTISYVKDSINKSDGSFSFSFRTDQGKNYTVNCNASGNDYEFTLEDNIGTVFSYDSKQHVTAKRAPLSLDKNHLPHSGKTSAGLNYSLDMEGNGDYVVSVNSCNNQDIRDDALNSAKEWLSSIGYDPADFNLKIKDYCPKKHR